MRYLTFLAFFLITGVAPAQSRLRKVEISKEISAMLPQDFTLLSDDWIARKYPAPVKPLAVYSDPNGRIDFSVTQKPSQFKPQDLKMLLAFYKANLLETFTKVDFIRQEVTQVKGKDFIVFEFVSTLADERAGSSLAPVQKYSIIEYTIQNGQLLIFTLHTPLNMKNEWQNTVRDIMASVKVQ
ncbi:hypothetical protein I2I11_09270 [Pontibacter sp. 172403-2]|uniref:hypothetical protein n=1 Tax=Pontibacter rufus TaxID=2791028 RepID=UPI0018AFB568|nr:hypothetical protein [Pontibacter sp. 172403-2]MBF9253480.1 hypothetical protein [Pontibacter sp. 172403-2]